MKQFNVSHHPGVSLNQSLNEEGLWPRCKSSVGYVRRRTSEEDHQNVYDQSLGVKSQTGKT